MPKHVSLGKNSTLKGAPRYVSDFEDMYLTTSCSGSDRPPGRAYDGEL